MVVVHTYILYLQLPEGAFQKEKDKNTSIKMNKQNGKKVEN